MKGFNSLRIKFAVLAVLALLAGQLSRSLNAEPSSEIENSDGLSGELEPAVDSQGPASVSSSTIVNQVTNLEFKHDAKSSRIAITTRQKPVFNETRSVGAKQIVYLFENTETPEKFQRAFDTTEFASAVAMFTLFQVPGKSKPTSKLIVQLRKEVSPTLTESDRGVTLSFPPTNEDPQVVAKKELASDHIFAKGGDFSGEVIQRLEIKNSDVQDVLRLIARTSGYNIVIGEDVTGKIGTLSLTNIPWDQAFTLVLQSKKLGFVREGSVLRVATTAALRQEKEEALLVEQAQHKVEPLKTLLLPVSYATAAELAPRAKTFLSERGAVEVDTRTNTIIVKDIESVVNRVQRLLQSLDTQPPRVSVSAKIVEMRSTLTRNIGIRTMSASGDFAGLNLGVQNTVSAGGNFIANISAANFANLTTAFMLGEKDNMLKLLANPSVSVVANQTGSVSQSLAFFMPVNTIVAGGAIQPSYNQVTTSLNLSVTPIVSGDGSIFMNVNISNEIPTPVSTGTPTIASRNIKTQVLIENGDTAVIGGVFQSQLTTEREGLPFLMRVPLLGYLFSQKTSVDTKSEIFIFLTAKIMNAEESFKRTL